MAAGGRPALIESAEEQKAVNKMTELHEQYRIAGWLEWEGGKWQVSKYDKTPLAYTNWGAGHPRA